MPSVAIVPAAGKAERFGGAKLLADVDGEPLLNRTIRCLVDGGVKHVVVVLPPGAAFATVALLSDPRILRVVNPDPSRGMFSSIQIGLASATGDPILVLPGDMPFVKTDTVAKVLDECRRTQTIVSPRYRNRHGHPVAFPGRLHDAIVKAPVASNLNEVLKGSGVQQTDVDVDDAGVVRDVDVPGDDVPPPV